MKGLKELDIQTILMPILTLMVGTAFFHYARPIIVPLIIAAALTYVLLPLVDLLKRLKIPHTIAVVIVMLVVIGVVILLMILLFGQIADFAEAAPLYKEKIVEALNSFQQKFSEYLKYLPGGLSNPQAIDLDMKQLQNVTGYFFEGLGSLTSALGRILILFFLTLFMMIDSNLFQRKLKSTFGSKQMEATEEIIGEINRQFKGFIRAKFSVMIGLAVVVTIGLLIFRVKYAYIWGPLVGIMNLVPYIGSIVSAIPPIIVAGIQHNSILYMLWVALFFLVIQFTEGNIITPRLTSESVDLNTTAVLVSVMYWGWLWGFIGIVLAVPITVAVKIVCDHVEPLKPIGMMLGSGRGE
jgi:predicted PurR-regulated permease PerM